MRTGIWIATVVLFVGLASAAVEACAVCLSAAAGGDRLVDAFNWSVLFLMGAPYVVLGSVGGWIFYAHRSAARKRDPAPHKAQVYRPAWNHKENGR
jgi:hypothetical protein